MSVKNKHILLGVTGGIAAYKAAFLTRLLCKAEAKVQVVMTQTAEQFIGAATFQGLTGNSVITHASGFTGTGEMYHIELARWADLFCIAPTSANTLAKLAHGVADNSLTATYLAVESIVAVAPAMNRAMWQHPAVQNNCRILKEHGVLIWGPDTGEQACGEQGEGRMLEPNELVTCINEQFGMRFLTGKKVVVTAGPTREPWDAVRCLSNFSSGKMGFAMAQAAQALGANVTLVSGPVALATPHAVTRINVTTAEQMRHAVIEQLPSTDLLIACAAVADYRPAQPLTKKIKKNKATLNLSLERTPDILADIGQRDTRPFLVGFAVETDALIANARAKLLQKNLDMIVANPVGENTPYGFDSDLNCATLLWRNGEKTFDVQSKTGLAKKLMQIITKHFYSRIQSSQPEDKNHAESSRQRHPTKNS